MALKNFVKEMRDGIGNMSRRGSDNGKHNSRRRGRSYIAPEGSSSSSSSSTMSINEQGLWENLPPELLHDIIGRIEKSQITWPARRDVVACASVCKSWRAVTREIVRTPEQCRLISFPISLKQPGPRDAQVQCFIRRERSTGTFRLYLGLSPGEMSKLLLAARKIRKATSTDFLISLVGNDFSRSSNTYIGKLRSNFLGTKFTIYDSQPPCDTAIHSNSLSQRKIFSKHVSSNVSPSNYSVATICYELNVLRTRGPRRMQCTMHSIPISAIQEGGNAPTPIEFKNCRNEQFPPSPTSKGKKPLIEFSSTSLAEPLDTSLNTRDPLVLKNKAPRWHEQLQCWCLNFKGRVTVASVKNFQLVAAAESGQNVPVVEQEKVILQFGKIGKDIFTMDYRYPLSAFQAFAICLSSFDTKPACE